MNGDYDRGGCVLITTAAVVAILLALLGGVVYQAHVKASFWQRQGVEITTWEVFMGATPIDRNIKER